MPHALATDVDLLIPKQKVVTLRFNDEADVAVWIGTLEARSPVCRAMGEMARAEDVAVGVDADASEVCRATCPES